jgi:3-phenylpropionate/trans-cinnamate dioxygenase ferredoxin subunit
MIYHGSELVLTESGGIMRMALVRVAKVDEVLPGFMKRVMAAEKELLIVNVGGTYYAMNDRCWHMNGDLSLGKLEGHVVTCPKHGSQYDVTSGKGLRGPKMAFIKLGPRDLPSFVTKVEGSDIMVDV